MSQALKAIKLPSKSKFNPSKNSGIDIKVIESFEKLALKSIPERTLITRTVYQKVGRSVLKTLLDYYELTLESRLFGSLFLNHDNFKTSVTYDLSMKFPYRFYPNVQSYFTKSKKGQLKRRHSSFHQRLHGTQESDLGEWNLRGDDAKKIANCS